MSTRVINILLAFVMILFLVVPVLGQTTGKIVGQVTEAATGEPLPGANVIIEGSSRGAATNFDGEFFIINVTPGTYTVKVRMMGYETVLVEGIRVSVNRSANIDVKMNLAVIEGKEVVVVAEKIAAKQYDFILVNFANGDMVGHTGVLEAAVRAAEAVDAQIGLLEKAVADAGCRFIITADHGNLEKMRDEETGEPHTAHTNQPVPFILVDDELKHVTLRSGGALCDVAPTVLRLLGLPVPDSMQGRVLAELLVDGPDPASIESTSTVRQATYQSDNGPRRQTAHYSEVHGHRYLDQITWEA